MRRAVQGVSATLAILIGVMLMAPEKVSAAQGSRVLYLGDSLSMGAFGRTLDRAMREQNLEVYTHVAGGASPYYWLKRFEPISCSIGYWEKTPAQERRVGYIREVPKLEDLISRHQPNVVIVQTGVNLYSTLRSKRRTQEDNVRTVESLIRDMCVAINQGGATSYWIAPPESHPDRYPVQLQQDFFAIMKRVVESQGGSVFESQAVTNWTASYPGESDGIHYGPTQATDWAVQVASNFNSFVSSNGFGGRTQLTQAGPLRAVPIALRYRGEDSEENPANSTGRVRTEIVIQDEVPEVPSAPLAPPAEEIPPVPVAPEAPVVAMAMAQEPAAQVIPDTSTNPVDAIGSPSAGEQKKPLETSDEIEVTLVLRQKSTVDHLNEVTYDNAFGLFEYEVVSVNSGVYPYETLRLAHMIVLHNKITGPNSFEIGDRLDLKLVKLEKYPSLQRIQMKDDLPMNLELPIYICKF